MTTPSRIAGIIEEMDWDTALAGALRQRIAGQEFTEKIRSMLNSNTEILARQNRLGETVREAIRAVTGYAREMAGDGAHPPCRPAGRTTGPDPWNAGPRRNSGERKLKDGRRRQEDRSGRTPDRPPGWPRRGSRPGIPAGFYAAAELERGPPGPYAPMNRTCSGRSCSSGIPSSQLPPFRSRSDHLSPSPTANGPSNSPPAKLPYQPQDGLGPVDRAPPQHRRASSPQSCSRPAGGLVSAPLAAGLGGQHRPN